MKNRFLILLKKNSYIQSKLYAVGFCLSGLLFLSADWLSTSQAPEGYTGAEGVTCRGCHGGNPLNANGGFISINGLPNEYVPGTVYPFSITITHASNRGRWGFAVKAIGSNSSVAGSFSSTNPNAGIIGSELGHINAPFQSGTTYTFNNLRWTAPATPTSTEQTIRFFAVGNAAGGSGSSSYFIYTTTKTILQKTSSINNTIPEIENWQATSSRGQINVFMNLNKSSKIQIALYTIDGKVVKKLAAQRLTAGKQMITIPLSEINPGTFILTIQNGKERESKKIILP